VLPASFSSNNSIGSSRNRLRGDFTLGLPMTERHPHDLLVSILRRLHDTDDVLTALAAACLAHIIQARASPLSSR